MDTLKHFAKSLEEKKPEPTPLKEKETEKLSPTALSEFSTLLRSIDDKYQKRSSEDNNHAAIEKLASEIKAIDKYPVEIRQKKLVELIYSYNRNDAFALFLLLLHKSAYPQLRSILEEKVTPGFWEDILHGKSAEPIFLASGYHEWVKLKKHVELREHKFSEKIYSSFAEKKIDKHRIPTRTPMEIVFGVWCSWQASNFLTASFRLSQALKILENFTEGFSEKSLEEWQTANAYYAKALGTEYNLKVSRQRALLNVAIKDYECSLKSSSTTPENKQKLQENIIKKKDLLIKVTTELFSIYSNCNHETLNLGQYWGDMCCVDVMLHHKINEKSQYKKIEYIKRLTNFLVAIAQPAKDKHWLFGHLIYVRTLAILVSSINEYSNNIRELSSDERAEILKLNSLSIYNHCVNAMKQIYVAYILIPNCDAIVHNAVLGDKDEIKAFQPKKEFQKLYKFFFHEAEHRAPSEEDFKEAIKKQKIAKSFTSSLIVSYQP